MTTTTETRTHSGQGSGVITSTAFAAPILPEMENVDRDYLSSVSTGDRKADHAASRNRAGITKERAWHQQTPAGVFAVVFMEADDIEAAMTTLATCQEPFDRHFRDEVRQVHGFEFDAGFEPPELLLDYGVGNNAAQAVAFCVPILPGKAQAHREQLESMSNGDLRLDYLAARKSAGITREMAWHQETPDGVIGVVYIEADDMQVAMGALARSDAPFDVDFRNKVREIHGFDLAEDSPPPELLLDYSA